MTALPGGCFPQFFVKSTVMQRDWKMDRLIHSLSLRGLNVVKPFNTVWYNKGAKPLPTMIDLPTLSDGTGLPALLIGNNKDIWAAFREFHGRNVGRKLANPFDTFVGELVDEALDETFGDDKTKCVIFYSWEISIDRLIAFQRLADVCGLAKLDEELHLSIHPTYGSWFALRAIVILPFLDASSLNLTDAVPDKLVVAIDEQEKSNACDLLQAAIAASARKESTAWKLWIDARRAVSNGKEYMYGKDQLEYHYTKNKAILDS